MSLDLLLNRLDAVPESLRCAPYRTPAQWGPQDAPVPFHRRSIKRALAAGSADIPAQLGWSRRAVVYNLFPRFGAAFDHDGDGQLGGGADDLTLNSHGHRETGTCLKMIAMLPHLVSMGVNVLHLLPVTAVGRVGRKGDLGSPYAIRNPEKIEPSLADPLLGDLPVEVQFAGLVEAAHRYGVRVVLEFVFRTASLDSDWIDEHSDWFYWIDASVPDRGVGDPPASGFGAPVFHPSELEQVFLAVTGAREGGEPVSPQVLARHVAEGYGALVPPPQAYRDWFAPPPAEITRDEHGVRGGSPPAKLRIPPAFADWPPDDTQPPWSDVTYLRLYRDPGDVYNYMAYNTLRSYDPSLAQPSNRVRPLWDRIRAIVPSFLDRFGIDGIMVDMGHALPPALGAAILEDARRVKPDVAFWEENFTIARGSAERGYDAVVGGALFAAPDVRTFREFVSTLQDEAAVAFFAAVENHNTPRSASGVGGVAVGFARWVLTVFLPGAMPFIHGGFELGESRPINTGLGFSVEEAARYTRLALFDRGALDWNSPQDLVGEIRRVIDARRTWAPALAAGERPPVHAVEDLDGCGLAFTVNGGRGRLRVAAGLDGRRSARLHNPGPDPWCDVFSGRLLQASQSWELKPGEFVVARSEPRAAPLGC